MGPTEDARHMRERNLVPDADEVWVESQELGIHSFGMPKEAALT